MALALDAAALPPPLALDAALPTNDLADLVSPPLLRLKVVNDKFNYMTPRSGGEAQATATATLQSPMLEDVLVPELCGLRLCERAARPDTPRLLATPTLHSLAAYSTHTAHRSTHAALAAPTSSRSRARARRSRSA